MWYYTMQYPNFYKVTKTTDKTVMLIQLEKRMVRATDGGYCQQGYEVPDPDRSYGKETRHIVKFCGDSAYVSVSDCGAMGKARVWDGEPKYADHMD